MKRICAWCHIELTSEPADQSKDLSSPISHGICEKCFNKVLYHEISIQSLIESIQLPILVVNPKGQVQTANKPALSIVNKTLKQVANQLGGNVMECIYAELPEGCGNTIHCSGCAIRQSVMKTFTSGQPVIGKIANNSLVTSAGIQQMKISITTELVGDIVLLQINSLTPLIEEKITPNLCPV